MFEPIHYRLFFSEKESTRPTSVVMFSTGFDQPLHAVFWHVGRKQWIYGPGLVAGALYDPMDERPFKETDRLEAELVARDILGLELPSEETVFAMFEEGIRNGWEFGPPRPS